MQNIVTPYVNTRCESPVLFLGYLKKKKNDEMYENKSTSLRKGPIIWISHGVRSTRQPIAKLSFHSLILA